MEQQRSAEVSTPHGSDADEGDPPSGFRVGPGGGSDTESDDRTGGVLADSGGGNVVTNILTSLDADGRAELSSSDDDL